jgi:hypothetical protein
LNDQKFIQSLIPELSHSDPVHYNQQNKNDHGKAYRYAYAHGQREAVFIFSLLKEAVEKVANKVSWQKINEEGHKILRAK